VYTHHNPQSTHGPFNILVPFHRTLRTKAIVYSSFGDPRRALRFEDKNIADEPSENQVLVEVLAAPVTGGDLSAIRGNFPLKTNTAPSVAGNQGVGKVLKVGKDVKSLKASDLVIPSKAGLGTWATHILAAENDFLSVTKLDPKNALEIPSTLAVSRIFSDFKLKANDIVIQSCYDTSLGLALLQLANSQKIKVINIISPGKTAATDTFKAAGATDIFQYEEIIKPEFQSKFQKSSSRPILGFTSTSGPSATEIARLLAPGGTLVTVGGSGLNTVTIPSSLFLFNQISVRGFWLYGWLERSTQEEKKAAVNSLLPELSKFKPTPTTSFSLSDFSSAIQKYLDPGNTSTIIFASSSSKK